MTALTRIKIEERAYSLTKFAPMDGMEYGTKVMAVVSPALGGLYEATKDGGNAIKMASDFAAVFKDPTLTPLLRQAIGQCFTPKNESLADEYVFNTWFSQHPGDLFQLGVQSAWALVKDFLPSSLVTMASDSQILQNLTAATAQDK